MYMYRLISCPAVNNYTRTYVCLVTLHVFLGAFHKSLDVACPDHQLAFSTST